jgi:Omp85 superfamily domain
VIRRAAAIACVALGAIAAPAAAQLPSIFPPGSYVVDTWYPKVFWTSREGFTAGGYYTIVFPLRYEDYPNPSPYRMALVLDGQASASGTRWIQMDAFAPDFVPGWRFRLTLKASRANRQNYFGVGNGTPYDAANVTDQQPFYYELEHLRTFARGEVQRKLFGPVRLLAGFNVEHWRLDSLAGPSLFGADLQSTPGLGRPANDVSARIGLVVDTRDDESAPQRGVLLQGILTRADSSIAGDVSYTRTFVSARGYLPIGSSFVIAARVAGQKMTGNPPLGTYYLMDASDGEIFGLGGAATDRGLPDYRLLGRDKLLGNFDLRYHVFQVPTLVRVTLLGFVDAARVFQTENFRLTTTGMAWSGGGGVMLQFMRNAFLGLTVGGGPDGAQVEAHTSWTF